MLPKIFSSNPIVSRKLVPIFFILGVLVSSCTPATQVPGITPTQPGVIDTAQTFSSDALGLCFSYPQGYLQIPYNDTVEIVAPEIPGSELRGLFWLEKSDAYDRTAQVIADQDVSMVPGLNPGRSTLTLGGEKAVVLDGMPGQDFTRKVYIVHEKTLYILTFTPTLSENVAAGDQMEVLFTAVTSSWAWSPCPAGK